MSFFDTSQFESVKSAQPIPTEVGFFESISRSYDQQYRVDSPYSLEDEIEEIWSEQLKTYEQLTGQRLDVPLDLGALGQYARDIKGEEQTFWSKTITGEVAPLTKQNIERLRKADEQIQALGNPDLKSFAQIVAQVQAAQQEIEAQTGEVAANGSLAGELIGSIAGSFSGRDPVTLATLGLGGFGRTIAAKVGTEMGIVGGLAALTTSQAVNPNRKLVGLPERSVVQDALFAAGGAGVIRGGAELVGALASRGLRAASPDIELDFRDAQLAEALGANLQSPRARAGLESLELTRQLEAASPYGTTPAGMARFTAELEDVRMVLGGLQTETALPFAATRPDVPFEYIERLADFQLVKERSPQVWTKLEEAQAKLTDIETQSAEIQTALDSTDLPAAVRLVDEEAATRLDVIEQRLAEVLPEPERAALMIERESIVQRVGVERVAKALEDAEIAPRKELQRLGKQRKARQKEYRQAFAAVERERDQIQALARAQQGAEQRAAVDIFTPAGLSRPYQGSMLSHAVVADQAARLNELDEIIPDAAEALVRSGTEPAAPEGIMDRIGRALGLTEERPDMLDIGLPEPVSADFVLSIDGRDVTVRELMDDLGDDIKLDEAMRTCLL